jgi:methylated-DNA-protein-cysteine methyltransferase-like protein
MTLYQRIYEVVLQIPKGNVATYSQIAALVGRCTPRIVGNAMAALPTGSNVPWHRVINSQGRISIRSDGNIDMKQRHLLESEGIQFADNGSIDLKKYNWLEFS